MSEATVLVDVFVFLLLRRTTKHACVHAHFRCAIYVPA